MAIWGSRDERSSAVERLHITRLDQQADDDGAAHRKDESGEPPTGHGASDGFYEVDLLTEEKVAVQEAATPPGQTPHATIADASVQVGQTSLGGTDDWARTEQLARYIVNLEDFRSAVHAASRDDLASRLLDGVDREVMTVGRFIAERLRAGEPTAGTSAEVQAAVVIMEWLVATLEGASTDSDEQLSSVYLSLAALRGWGTAA